MQKTTKIAISIPMTLLETIEHEREATGESRSEFLRRAVESFLRQKDKEEEIAQYIRGYQENPETGEELGWVEAASQAVLAEYPWEEEAQQ